MWTFVHFVRVNSWFEVSSGQTMGGWVCVWKLKNMVKRKKSEEGICQSPRRRWHQQRPVIVGFQDLERDEK